MEHWIDHIFNFLEMLETEKYKSWNVQNLLFWENKTENARFTN